MPSEERLPEPYDAGVGRSNWRSRREAEREGMLIADVMCASAKVARFALEFGRDATMSANALAKKEEAIESRAFESEIDNVNGVGGR